MSAVLEAAAYTAEGARRPRAVRLPPDPFDGRVHPSVMHQAVRVYLANQRQGTAASKTRGLVSGGNRKPWRQKGTGRARQGSIRSPLWPGGGTVFGPVPRSYRLGLPKKVRRLARRSALNARARERALAVIEPLTFEEPKTKRMAALLGRMGLGEARVLLLTGEVKPNLALSARNLGNVRVMRYADATAYDILRAEALLIEEPVLGTLEPGGEVTPLLAAAEAPAPEGAEAPSREVTAEAAPAKRRLGMRKAPARKAQAAEGRAPAGGEEKKRRKGPAKKVAPKKPATKPAAKKPTGKKP